MKPNLPLLLCTGRIDKPDDSGKGSIHVGEPLIEGSLAFKPGANTTCSVIDKSENGEEIELFYRRKQKPSTQKRGGKKPLRK